MRKCLFVFPNSPLSSSFSGGASRFLESFQALAGLNVEIHVWRPIESSFAVSVLSHEHHESREQSSLRALAKSWEDVFYERPSVADTPIRFGISLVFRPVDLVFPEVGVLKSRFRSALVKLRPDFVWAEWTLSGAIVASTNLSIPWVYTHYDWIYKVSRIRHLISNREVSLIDKLVQHATRRSEIRISKRASTVITGSNTEAAELTQLGCKNVTVIPTTYNSLRLTRRVAEQGLRIVHLGGLNTTANFQGLMAYVTKVHPILSEQWKATFGGDIPLHIIGDTCLAKPNLIEQLKRVNATLHGHVSELSSVIQPFDISILPYEFDSGTRTKLPLLFNHSQVVVTTAAAVRGSSEVRNGKNCIVLDSLEDFPRAIIELAKAARERERIGREAKSTFEKCYTLASQLPTFRRVLASIS